MSKPYPFEALPKIFRQEQKWVEGLLASLPKLGFAERLRAHLQSELSNYLGLTVKLRLADTASVSFKEISSQYLSQKSLLALISLAPVPGRVVLELDPTLAFVSVDQLLGGEAKEEGFERVVKQKASDIDQGVLSYLLLKIISAVYRFCGASATVHFRLEEIVTGTEKLKPFFKEEEKALLFSYHVGLDDKVGFVRLLVPSSVAQKLSSSVSSVSTEKEEEALLERLARYDFLKTELRAVGGTTMLKGEEIEKLEKGDIILLDETRVKLGPKKNLEGEVMVRVGDGKKISVSSSLVAVPKEGRKMAVRLERILVSS
ncbi:MAG: hypothetical protein Q7S00_06030 [bacterium]|nr:hypothetical protein [bacterium]